MSSAGQAIGLTAWPRESRGEGGAGEIFRRRGRGRRDLAWAGRRGRGARDLAAAGSMPSSSRTTPHRLVTVTVVLGGGRRRRLCGPAAEQPPPPPAPLPVAAPDAEGERRQIGRAHV